MARILTNLSEFPAKLRGCAVAIGNFDGVHLGHAALIGQLVDLADRVSGLPVVLTFDPPPAVVLFPQRPVSPPLSSIQRRAELLGKLDVEAVVVLPTNPQLLSLSAVDFFQQTIRTTLAARAMVEGPNFRFGHDRLGDVSTLQALCSDSNLVLKIVEAKADSGGEMISSTRIRSLLQTGNIEAANRCLTEPYCIRGLVKQGAGRGRKLGFPTANLESIDSLIPAHGVYAGRVRVDGQAYAAAMNIGPNPTFGESSSKIEIHIIGFSGMLYGLPLTCQLLEKIRDVRKFDSVEQLQQQIAADAAQCVSAVHASSVD